jgi:hypothetical protein
VPPQEVDLGMDIASAREKVEAFAQPQMRRRPL